LERLQRILAARGVASRRAAETLITEGRVAVNGQIVTELGTRANPATDEIRVDNEIIRQPPLRYLMLNKPTGYITTTSDERDRWTVMDLVRVSERVFPVGRLDRDTEGLLLLTNDGDIAHRIMHPRYKLTKEYHVLTRTRPTEPVAAHPRRCRDRAAPSHSGGSPAAPGDGRWPGSDNQRARRDQSPHSADHGCCRH